MGRLNLSFVVAVFTVFTLGDDLSYCSSISLSINNTLKSRLWEQSTENQETKPYMKLNVEI